MVAIVDVLHFQLGINGTRALEAADQWTVKLFTYLLCGREGHASMCYSFASIGGILHAIYNDYIGLHEPDQS